MENTNVFKEVNLKQLNNIKISSQIKLKNINEIKSEKVKLEKEKLKKIYNPEEVIIRPSKEGLDREEYKKRYLLKFFDKDDVNYNENKTQNTTFHTTKSSNFNKAKNNNGKCNDLVTGKDIKKNINDFDFFTEIKTNDNLFGMNCLKIKKQYEENEYYNYNDLNDDYNTNKEDSITVNFMKIIEKFSFNIFEYLPNNEILNIKTTSRQFNDSVDTYMIFKNSIFSILTQEISNELIKDSINEKSDLSNTKNSLNESQFKKKYKFSSQPASMYKINNKNSKIIKGKKLS